ncbi:MAG TPA: hypothetical protein VJM53_11160 [Burkholderiales bacterium]|nr:hypothetical protein [Burkholderiales bacterium]
MKKLHLLACAVTFAFSSVAFAGETLRTPVAGEKLDSGLGKLNGRYTGAEFKSELYVVGQKLDSGLGKLGRNYTGAEFMTELQIVGESIDSGLGDLSASYTGAEFMYNELAVVGEKKDSGLGEMTKEDVTILTIISSL